MDEALHSAASHSASATAAAAEGQQGDASPPQPQPRASAQPPPPPIRLLLEPARATRANSSAGATALLFPRRAPLGTQRLAQLFAVLAEMHRAVTARRIVTKRHVAAPLFAPSLNLATQAHSSPLIPTLFCRARAPSQRHLLPHAAALRLAGRRGSARRLPQRHAGAFHARARRRRLFQGPLERAPHAAHARRHTPARLLADGARGAAGAPRAGLACAAGAAERRAVDRRGGEGRGVSQSERARGKTEAAAGGPWRAGHCQLRHCALRTAIEQRADCKCLGKRARAILMLPLDAS
ncbi:hypothetical protein FA09DRAFT_230546 [Tilletiopsis washingtonensis]|uniref:Uncharacterized protein n=1 Tax=Tilletiopsis washingtonensis TaxID=58919 RepID=A0A316ZGL0_9BASI|nr:hypothetical protein FA09DRAFT_230546 [Tilletiopsis washingtonensis]PWN99423.1 hypothetical protein FA09DRAFT_230546 [Tilletiopsis washingtonensis]